MPFGFTKVSVTFQRALDIVFSGFEWKSCLVYIDDVTVFSNAIEKHLWHVEETLCILSRASVPQKLSKCEFFCITIMYLRYVTKS